MGYNMKAYLDLEITEELIERAIELGACQGGLNYAREFIGNRVSALPGKYADWCARLINGPSQLGSGTIVWYLNGKLHRADGPAYESGNYKEWYLNGKVHRIDGPAFEYGKIKEYWLNGVQYESLPRS